MRYSLLAFFSLFILLGTSCRKNNSDLDLPTGSRLDSVTLRAASDNLVVGGTKFKYDGAGNLIQYIVNNNRTIQFRYDAQNRLIAVSPYNGSTSSSSRDTLVYSTNGSIVRSYRSASGTTSLVGAKVYVFDSNNRLIADSTYLSNGFPFAYFYFKYSYDAADNMQSSTLYALNASNPISYTRQDSTVYTFDGNENPFYRYSFAIYSLNATYPIPANPYDPIIYSSPNVGFLFSKHNRVSSSSFGRTSTQPDNIISYSSTYYKNGLIRTQFANYNTASSGNSIAEFLYR